MRAHQPAVAVGVDLVVGELVALGWIEADHVVDLLDHYHDTLRRGGLGGRQDGGRGERGGGGRQKGAAGEQGGAPRIQAGGLCQGFRNGASATSSGLRRQELAPRFGCAAPAPFPWPTGRGLGKRAA